MSSTVKQDGDYVWDGRFPHCDHRILHRKGECEICDTYAPMLQYIRDMWGINYTGEHTVLDEQGQFVLPDPAEIARPYSILNKWGGNIAKTKKMLEDTDKFFEDLSKIFETYDKEDENQDGKSGTEAKHK